MENEEKRDVQRERLVDLIRTADIMAFGEEKPWAEILADYLIANHVKVLPCEIGTTYYRIVTKRPKVDMDYFSYIRESKLSWYNIDKVLVDLGKTVFLDRNEAEIALANILSAKKPA